MWKFYIEKERKIRIWNQRERKKERKNMKILNSEKGINKYENFTSKKRETNKQKM